ncbi:Aminoglycoside phosphotransferase domain-containing protein [Madurella fahalii]|uniref:Aminoglycoside phosphotransferase domain-containing protein n=1 Tax=Madurella fahalii TaxID=1157608 RepID=A0ABQ0G4Q9_9PEZI
MTTTYPEYSVDAEIDAFFKKTSATRAACDARARELAGDNVVPVEIQGVCSYSVYAGPELEYVVQFRLESLALKAEVTSQVNEVYGSLAPKLSFEGKVGEGEGKGEPLYVYLMTRVRGVTHLDFILAHDIPENSPDNRAWRKNIIGDIAHFMALSWKAPRPVSQEYRASLKQAYIRDLQALYSALPPRFQSIIQTCIDSIDNIMSLPMVLLHRDFGSCNIMVDEVTCHLVGVIDWAEAEVCPFGLNLHSLQSLTGKLHLRNGWTRFEDYDTLQDAFWGRFKQEVGGLSYDQLRTIKLARALGLLLSSGFTSRLANEPEPVPIGDDERGRYNMMSLDGFLINPQTKFDGLE